MRSTARLADLDLIAIVQDPLFRRHPIDGCAVTAVQVADLELSGLGGDRAMTPRNRRVFEDQIVGGVATNRKLLFMEREGRILQWPGNTDQPRVCAHRLCGSQGKVK